MHEAAGCRSSLPPHSSPVSDIVVLPAPPPVLVGKAIHLHVLVRSHCRYSTKVLWIRQPARGTWLTVSYTFRNHQHQKATARLMTVMLSIFYNSNAICLYFGQFSLHDVLFGKYLYYIRLGCQTHSCKGPKFKVQSKLWVKQG